VWELTLVPKLIINLTILYNCSYKLILCVVRAIHRGRKVWGIRWVEASPQPIPQQFLLEPGYFNTRLRVPISQLIPQPTIMPNVFPNKRRYIFLPNVFPNRSFDDRDVIPQLFPNVFTNLLPNSLDVLFPNLFPYLLPNLFPNLFPKLFPNLFPNLFTNLFPNLLPN
jgi:hypothetical protein